MAYSWKVLIFEAIKIVIVIIIVIGFLVWKKYRAPTTAEVILENVPSEVFHGKVDSIYVVKNDHNTTKAILSSDYTYSLWPEWESQIKLGDSLSKSKGSFIVEVFKKDKKKIILDYRVLVKNYR